MIYSQWCETGPSVSRLGFGTTRFLPKDLVDNEGIRRCVGLVEYAIEKGINYFDVAPTYSNGFAERILEMTFERTEKQI